MILSLDICSDLAYIANAMKTYRVRINRFTCTAPLVGKIEYWLDFLAEFGSPKIVAYDKRWVVLEFDWHTDAVAFVAYQLNKDHEEAAAYIDTMWNGELLRSGK